MGGICGRKIMSLEKKKECSEIERESVREKERDCDIYEDQ